MSRLRDALDRPIREQPRRFAAAIALLAVLAVVVTLSPWSSDPGGDRDSPAAPSAPHGPVVNATSPQRTQTTSSSKGASATVESRRAARRFLASYLPVLYGHGDSAKVAGASTPLRRALAKAPPVPRRIRARRPRLVHLVAEPQAATSVLMTVTIDDGVVAPFHLIFTVERDARGRWLTTNIAND